MNKFIANLVRFGVITCALSLTPITAQEGGSERSGGGDPIRVYAIDFPDQDKLKSAIKISLQKTHESKYLNRLNNAIRAEIEHLRDEKKFRYLPAKVFLMPQISYYDYLVSVGEITLPKKGSIVYFTEQVQEENYTTNVLARVIFQAVLHHVLSLGLEKDEDFCNGLGTSLAHGSFNSEYDEKLVEMYERLDFIDHKKIRKKDRVENYKEVSRIIRNAFHSPLDYIHGDSFFTYWENHQRRAVKRLFKKELENVQWGRIEHFIKKVCPKIINVKCLASSVYWAKKTDDEIRTLEKFGRRPYRYDLTNRFNNPNNKLYLKYF